MLNKHIQKELSDKLSKAEMRREYAKIVKELYLHFAEIEDSYLWKHMSMTSELLNLYRINYGNNGNTKDLKAIERVEREVYDTIESFRELKKIVTLI